MTFEEYTRHIDWSFTVGRRRTRQAASNVLEFEGAQALPEAEETVDDPLRMARCPLVGKAVADIVAAVDREHRDVVTTNRARRRAPGRGGPAGRDDVGGQVRGHNGCRRCLARNEVRRPRPRVMWPSLKI